MFIKLILKINTYKFKMKKSMQIKLLIINKLISMLNKTSMIYISRCYNSSN